MKGQMHEKMSFCRASTTPSSIHGERVRTSPVAKNTSNPHDWSRHGGPCNSGHCPILIPIMLLNVPAATVRYLEFSFSFKRSCMLSSTYRIWRHVAMLTLAWVAAWPSWSLVARSNECLSLLRSWQSYVPSGRKNERVDNWGCLRKARHSF